MIMLVSWSKNFSIKPSLDCCENPILVGNGECDSDYKYDIKCNNDGGDCCDNNWIGDGFCDDCNNFESCANFDGGDCA